jgi:ABC-type Fe3+/spermidine/putrescine transport system ATPase subunit
MSRITLHGVTKRFAKVTAVDGVSLCIEQGELVTLLGPSGCGKTTLLRMIAGFEEPDTGTICFDDAVMNGVPPEKRAFGMVFQSYALFPNMSVEGNVTFGLRAAGFSRENASARAAEALSLVRLSGYENRRPSQLSGGQKQRVALARAIALCPRILLLDEPLSALDAKIRLFLRGEIRAIQKSTGITTVYVTHDQEEALAISDRIAVMNEGSIQQVGTPFDVYEEPATRFVAGFIGISNVIEADLSGGVCRAAGGLELELDGFCPPGRTGRVFVSVRPESIRVVDPEDARDGARETNLLRARVRSIEYLGSVKRMVAECANGMTFTVDSHGNGAENAGRKGEVLLHIPASKLRVLDP